MNVSLQAVITAQVDLFRSSISTTNFLVDGSTLDKSKAQTYPSTAYVNTKICSTFNAIGALWTFTAIGANFAEVVLTMVR